MIVLEAQCTSQISEAKKFLRCLLYERHSLKSVKWNSNNLNLYIVIYKKLVHPKLVYIIVLASYSFEKCKIILQISKSCSKLARDIRTSKTRCDSHVLWWEIFSSAKQKCVHKLAFLTALIFLTDWTQSYIEYHSTVGQTKNETPLFISIQTIVEKLNWYQSSWIIVYFNLML